jgi:hypothetical protein
MESNASQCADKIFGRNSGLPENAGESANLDFSVHRDDASNCSATHNQMATLLSELHEAQLLQGSNRLTP